MVVDGIRSRTKHWARVILGILAVSAAVAGLSTGARKALSAGSEASNDGAPTAKTTNESDSQTSVVALARLLPAAGLISVGARPGARVVEIKVREGDRVQAGAELAVLEGHEAAVEQARLASAKRQRAQAEWSARLDAAQKAAERVLPRRDSARGLFKQFSGTLKGKERFDAETALEQLENEAARIELELKLLGGRPPEGGAAGKAKAEPRNPEADALAAEVAMAQAAARDLEIRAPASGRILRVLVHPGEVSPGTIVEMGAVSSMIARAEVYQSEVPRIRPGDSAEVDILGTRVGGKVQRIGSIVGKNQLTNIDPRAPRDLRVVEVTILLDSAEPAARYVDMEVEAVIHPSGTAREGASGAGKGTAARRPE